MNTRILLCDGVEQSCLNILASEGFEVDEKPKLKNEELLACIGDYDAMVVRSATKVTMEVLAKATRLKVVGRAGAGVDNIDVDAATRRGVLVMNTPGGNTISTAEHTLSLILAMARNIPQAAHSLREGKWERKAFVGTELCGKTIGIVGVGKVGKEVAVRCRAFDMTILAYDPLLLPETAARESIELVSFEELIRRSDIITVHTPLNDDTMGLIGAKQLEQCKEGVRIVNCARGGIVDEAALLDALQSGKVSGAALDVFEHEPPKQSALVEHPRVIATPHLGASTGEAQDKVARQIGKQIADYFKERGIAGAVNGEAIQFSTRPELKPFVTLAEIIGTIHAQIMEGSLKGIGVTWSGEVLSDSGELIISAVLKGMLTHLLTEPVNLINARAVASELGIAVTEHREPAHPVYTHLVTVECTSTRHRRVLAGTVFGGAHVRLVRIDEFGLEVNPEGYLLLYRNVDKPGMLAAVGSKLASAGINIAGLSLGREGPGKMAQTVINVDSAIPEEILGNLASMEGVYDVRLVRL